MVCLAFAPPYAIRIVEWKVDGCDLRTSSVVPTSYVQGRWNKVHHLDAEKGLLGRQFGYIEECIVQIRTLGEEFAFDSKIQSGARYTHKPVAELVQLQEAYNILLFS